MVISFVSNYLNHHQLPFSKAMSQMEDVEYYFIQTEEMEAERKNMGWGFKAEDYPFFKEYSKDPDGCKKLIMDSDVVIFGGTDDESFIMPRLKAGRFVLRYSERIYKDGQWKFISPRGLIKKYHDHVRFKSNVYLLCSGAYVASDFSLIHAYKNRMLTWGYFPEFVEYSEEELFGNKHLKSSGDKLRIMWCGRQIDWKHAEHMIFLTSALSKKGYEFEVSLIGDGPLHDELVTMANEYDVADKINFKPFMEPAKIREEMLASDIYVFTSDYKEGWGAVLNEAMNAGCAVVAGSGIGAVPYLVHHGENGMVYRNGDIDEMINLVQILIHNDDMRREIGQNAFETIRDTWNADVAAERLIDFIKSHMDDSEELSVHDDGGPVCPAPNLPPSLGYEYTRM